MNRLFLAVTLVGSLLMSGCCWVGYAVNGFKPLSTNTEAPVAQKPASKKEKVSAAAEKTKNALAGIADTTASGNSVKVNLSGDFLFTKGSSQLSDGAKKKIKAIADALKRDKDNKITVIGYTDNKGNKSSNQKLSERRAKAVMKELIADGIASTKVSAIGKGDEEPVASNDTEEGRAKNRRTELKITK